MTERPHISVERLVAYYAVISAIYASSTSSTTIGEIVDDALDRAYRACDEGLLGLEIMSFEYDPAD